MASFGSALAYLERPVCLSAGWVVVEGTTARDGRTEMEGVAEDDRTG